MQLSNEPAEALAKKLVDTSDGAFALCGFASGGEVKHCCQATSIDLDDSRFRGDGERPKACKTGTSNFCA